jgi:hypothetical protein
VILLSIVGAILMLGSTAVIVIEALTQQEISKMDVALHLGVIVAGLVLTVPRRLLAVLEKVPKLKLSK